MTESERKKYIVKANEFQKKIQKEKEKYEKRVRLFKVHTKEEFDNAISQTLQENRMPEVVTSKE